MQTTQAKANQKIGRYQILSELGKGSMGVVYLAYDPQLDREVAVKTIRLPKGMGAAHSKKLTHNLLGEARLSGRLSHPGIVRVYDAGVEKKQPYIVLERIEGTTLAQRMEETGVIEREEAVQVMEELLDTVAYAHDKKIVHRDLKPANIMIQADGRVRVMDFGIAHVMAGDAKGRAVLAGTPRYMSPEAIQGLDVDQRSDVFSLGVTLYEMLGGRRPFLQKEFNALREAVVSERPTPLISLNPNLPPSFYQLVERALSKDPSKRFENADAMRQALLECADDEVEPPEQTRGPTPRARQAILERIRERVEKQGDFPATSQYVAKVTAAAMSPSTSASSIAKEILRDFALTNRILRTVNSPFYSSGCGQIRTISRAVVILGVDTVLSVAGGLSIFEHFHNRSDMDGLKSQAVKALMTALHARKLAHALELDNAEEAFICGMLHHLGRLLTAFYFRDEQKKIEELISQGMDEEQASRKVMRLSYGEISQGMAELWNMPETIVRSIRGLPPDHRGRLRTIEQKVQGVVSMADELGKATLIPETRRRKQALTGIARGFRDKIRISAQTLEKQVADAIRNAWDISHDLRVDLKRIGVADTVLREAVGEEAMNEVAGQAEPISNVRGADLSVDESSPSLDLSDPLDDSDPGAAAATAKRQNIIITAVNEIVEALTGDFEINNVLTMILEAMYRDVTCDHVLMAMTNPERTQVTARFGLGDDFDRISELFNLPLRGRSGLPARCILEKQEFVVNDIGQNGHGKLMPRSLLKLLGPQSLIFMPLVAKDNAIGLFLVSRKPGKDPFDKQDLRDIRTLRNQALLAIHQSVGHR